MKIILKALAFACVGSLLWRGQLKKVSSTEWSIFFVGVIGAGWPAFWLASPRTTEEIAWTFSIVLEALAGLSQGYALFTTPRDATISLPLPSYLSMMFLARFLYVPHWLIGQVYYGIPVERIPFGSALVEAFVMAVVVYGGWILYHYQERPSAETEVGGKEPFLPHVIDMTAGSATAKNTSFGGEEETGL